MPASMPKSATRPTPAKTRRSSCSARFRPTSCPTRWEPGLGQASQCSVKRRSLLRNGLGSPPGKRPRPDRPRQRFPSARGTASWHRITAGSTVTSHHCSLLSTALARYVPAQLRSRLLDMAASAERARAEWLDATRETRRDHHQYRARVSPAAAAAAQPRAFCTGLLAYPNPASSLSSGPSQELRPSPELQPQAEVIALVHQATDALAALVASNLAQAKAAADGRRIFVPTRSLTQQYDVSRATRTAASLVWQASGPSHAHSCSPEQQPKSRPICGHASAVRQPFATIGRRTAPGRLRAESSDGH